MGGRGSSGGGGNGLGFANDFGRRTRNKTQDEVTNLINPNYELGREYQNNCQRCVYANELARRGYDVEADPVGNSRTDPILNGGWRRVMEGQTWDNVPANRTSSAVDKLNSKMAEYGEGARAVVYVAWKGGRSAHVFNAEYTGGKAVYTDAQTGMTVNIDYYMDAANKAKTMVSRIDNLKFTEKITKCASRRTKK